MKLKHIIYECISPSYAANWNLIRRIRSIC